MSFADSLTFNGTRYPTPELAERAAREAEAAAKRAEDTEVARRKRFEDDLRARYLQAGATPAEWERDKGSLIADARRKAALASTDMMRTLNTHRYG